MPRERQIKEWPSSVTVCVCVLLPARDTLKMYRQFPQSCGWHCWSVWHPTDSDCSPYHRGMWLREQHKNHYDYFSQRFVCPSRETQNTLTCRLTRILLGPAELPPTGAGTLVGSVAWFTELGAALVLLQGAQRHICTVETDRRGLQHLHKPDEK